MSHFPFVISLLFKNINFLLSGVIFVVAFQCRGSWEENGTNYVIATAVGSRKHLCLVSITIPFEALFYWDLKFLNFWTVILVIKHLNEQLLV